MNAKNLNQKYRILVLTNLSNTSESALKNAVQLAKVLQGSVEAFHVKSPSKVVTQINQLSAERAIHEDYYKTKSILKQIINKIEKEEGIRIKYEVAYGNIKNEIRQKIAQVQPEIVLLGKRKVKRVDVLRRGITQFLLDECDANILITGEDHKLHSYTDISLGVFGQSLQKEGIEIINDLKEQNNNPIRYFSIRSKKNAEEATSRNDREMISYVFSEGTNALDGLASYVSKTNTQLLCIPRNLDGNRKVSKLKRVRIPVRVVDKLDIPVLITR